MIETIRPATEHDQATIKAMVRGEKLNPRGLDWPNFMVAERDGAIVGVAQIRKYGDGGRELASLVVARHLRGQGISAKLIDALLADEHQPIFVMLDQRHASHYARWDFKPTDLQAAPPAIRSNYRIGRIVTKLAPLFVGRLISLVMLKRDRSP